jgi:hypothetical protein
MYNLINTCDFSQEQELILQFVKTNNHTTVLFMGKAEREIPTGQTKDQSE